VNLDHAFTFQPGCEGILGLDRYDPSVSACCPASTLRALIDRPGGDLEDFATQHQLERYAKAMKALEELGEAIVEIVPFGAVVGDFVFRPFLIGLREYLALKEADLV
jgi:hypothetical protein